MSDLDLLIENGTILTMNPRNDIITEGTIAVKNGVIVDIGAHEELGDKYNAKRVIDASDSIVMPGLIDTYAHAGHAMIKGIWNPFKGWPSSDRTCSARKHNFPIFRAFSAK